MKQWLDEWLTKREQKVLYFLCFFLLMGLLVGSTHRQHRTHAAHSTRPLELSLQKDSLQLVDIRKANRDELMSLPGIGAVKADQILAYRASHGFQACTDLLNITGIGPKTLDKMRAHLVWFGSPPDSLTGETKKLSEPKILTGRVNLNNATAQELMQLTGIGPVKADAILAKRAELGRFDSIEQIMDVKGIGPKTFAKIKDRITTGD